MHIPALRGTDIYVSKMYFNGESAYLLRVGEYFSVLSTSDLMLAINELERMSSQEE
jgi:hypothetical protein